MTTPDRDIERALNASTVQLPDGLRGRILDAIDTGDDRAAPTHHLAQMNIARFRALGRPVLIGHSRKRFLGKVLGRNVEERTDGTVGVSLALADQHVDILRLHDIRASRDALVAFRTIRGGVD